MSSCLLCPCKAMSDQELEKHQREQVSSELALEIFAFKPLLNSCLISPICCNVLHCLLKFPEAVVSVIWNLEGRRLLSTGEQGDLVPLLNKLAR